MQKKVVKVGPTFKCINSAVIYTPEHCTAKIFAIPYEVSTIIFTYDSYSSLIGQLGNTVYDNSENIVAVQDATDKSIKQVNFSGDFKSGNYIVKAMLWYGGITHVIKEITSNFTI